MSGGDTVPPFMQKPKYQVKPALLEPQVTPGQFNIRESDYTWTDLDNDGKIDVANPSRHSLTYGEISFKSMLLRDKYTTPEGRLNLLFARSLRDHLNKIWNKTVVQVVIDRVKDGDPSNNTPAEALCTGQDGNVNAICQKEVHKGYDAKGAQNRNEQDLNLFQGGDLKGLTDTTYYFGNNGLDYDIMWISPHEENTWGESRGGGHMKRAYHGYWIVDKGSVDPRITTTGETGEETLGKFVDAAANHGLEVMFDVVANHRAPESTNNGEVYYEGKPVASYSDDVKCDHDFKPCNDMGLGYCADENDQEIQLVENQQCYESQFFHHWPAVDNWDGNPSEFKLHNYWIEDLIDFNWSNPKVFDFLKQAYRKWFSLKGPGGNKALHARYDAVKHETAEDFHNLDTAIRESNPDMQLSVGEWFGFGLPTKHQPNIAMGNEKGAEYLVNTRMGLFDFHLHDLLNAMGNPLSGLNYQEGPNDQALGNYVEALLMSPLSFGLHTFVDNHDKPRFKNRTYQQSGTFNTEWKMYSDEYQDEAFKLQYCLPGTPYVYYGSEAYLWDPGHRNGFFGAGGDPYNRGTLFFFGTTPKDLMQTDGYRFFRALNDFRHSNPALRLGNGKRLKQTNPARNLVFEREFAGNHVLYIHVRSVDGKKTTSGHLQEIKIDWPDGTYKDPFSNIKYKIGHGKITPVDGTYTDVKGSSITVVNGQLAPYEYKGNSVPETLYQDVDSKKSYRVFEDGIFVPAQDADLPDGKYELATGDMVKVTDGETQLLEYRGKLKNADTGEYFDFTNWAELSDGFYMTVNGTIVEISDGEAALPDGERTYKNMSNGAVYKISENDLYVKSGLEKLPNGTYLAPSGTVFHIGNNNRITYTKPFHTIVLARDDWQNTAKIADHEMEIE